jgi:hypothetical protein
MTILYYPWFDHGDYIWGRVQITKLLILRLSQSIPSHPLSMICKHSVAVSIKFQCCFSFEESCFRTLSIVQCFSLKHWTIDKALKQDSSKCITPSSNPFRIDLLLSVHQHATISATILRDTIGTWFGRNGHPQVYLNLNISMIQISSSALQSQILTPSIHAHLQGEIRTQLLYMYSSISQTRGTLMCFEFHEGTQQ